MPNAFGVEKHNKLIVCVHLPLKGMPNGGKAWLQGNYWYLLLSVEDGRKGTMSKGGG